MSDYYERKKKEDVEMAKKLVIELQYALDAVRFAIENEEYNYLIETRIGVIKRIAGGEFKVS